MRPGSIIINVARCVKGRDRTDHCSVGQAKIAKLIEMNATTEAQRDGALRLIESHRRDLSAAHVEISALGNRYRGMLMAERQCAESHFPFAESVPAVRHD